MCTLTKHDVSCEYLLKYRCLLAFFLLKVLAVREKVIPLHPLSRTNETSSKTRLRSVREGDKESLCKLSAMKLASIAETQPSLQKEFFEKIYIRQIKQYKKRNQFFDELILGRRKTNRQVCLILNSNLEARSETDTNKCSLINKAAVKDILQCRV